MNPPFGTPYDDPPFGNHPMSNEPKPVRPNAVAGIAVVCLCIVAMTAIIGVVKFAKPCPPCPECPEPVIKTFVAPEALDEEFGPAIPQRGAGFRQSNHLLFVHSDAPKLPPPVPPAPSNGVKVLASLYDRSISTWFGVVEIGGHDFAFARAVGGNVELERLPKSPRDDQTLPPGAFIPLRDEDEDKLEAAPEK